MQAAIYSSNPDKIDACEISNYHADISHANFQRYSILITTGQISPTVQLMLKGFLKSCDAIMLSNDLT